jgi:transposase
MRGKDREGANEGMQTPESYVNERLDHLGVVAGVCEEIGLAGETNHHVSMGTTTVAMILNGLGFSNRRLYLVPQFFANKPVEHLLGPGIEAADLNDDCLDRALDWLYAQDPTQVFAGIATQARKIFGVSARHVHVDTTSFAVSGAYAGDESADSKASVIAITYGYSRDHREDLCAVDARARHDAGGRCAAVLAPEGLATVVTK